MSPFRRWSKESEFCSVEHAEAYRNQTLSRLLGGEDAAGAERPPLPVEGLAPPPEALVEAQPETPAELPEARLQLPPAENVAGGGTLEDTEIPMGLPWPAEEPKAEEGLASPELPPLQDEPEPASYEQSSPTLHEEAAWPDLAEMAQDGATKTPSQDPAEPPEKDFSPQPTYIVDSLLGSAPSGDGVGKQTAEDALQALRNLVKSTRDETIAAETEEQVDLPSSNTSDTALHADEPIALGAPEHGESAGDPPFVGDAGEAIESEGFEVLDAALASTMQREPEAAPEEPAGLDLFEPELSAEFEEDLAADAGAEHAISLLSRLTEHEATPPLEGLETELPAQIEDAEPAHAAFEDAVLNLASGEALSSADAAKEPDVGAEHEAAEDVIARLMETTPPDVTAPSGELGADGKVLSFPVPAQKAADQPSDAPDEARPAGSERPLDLEPHLELLPVEPEMLLGSSQGPAAGSDADGASQTEGRTPALAAAPPPAEASEPGVGTLPLESARGPSEDDWASEAMRPYMATDPLLDNLALRGLAAANAPDSVSPLSEDREPMAPRPEPVLPQGLLAGHDPEAPALGELTVTELIGGEPAARDPETMLEAMEAETQLLSVG